MDTNQYKTRQRTEWDSVSGGWRKWWPVIEEGACSVSERLLDRARVASGQRILDVATGIGEPAVSAALRVGAQGSVLATDLSPLMLEVARERAAELALENIEFRAVDAEELALQESFDAVLCRWGLMFMPDPTAALTRMRQLLNSGGWLAAAVWAAPAQVPFLSLAMGVVRRELKLPPPPPNMPGLFSLADAAQLERRFQQAGLTEIGSESVAVTFTLPSAEAYAEFLREVASPITALLIDQPAARQHEVWSAITAAAVDFLDDDGSLRMENTAIIVTGRAP